MLFHCGVISRREHMAGTEDGRGRLLPRGRILTKRCIDSTLERTHLVNGPAPATPGGGSRGRAVIAICTSRLGAMEIAEAVRESSIDDPLRVRITSAASRIDSRVHRGALVC